MLRLGYALRGMRRLADICGVQASVQRDQRSNKELLLAVIRRLLLSQYPRKSLAELLAHSSKGLAAHQT